MAEVSRRKVLAVGGAAAAATVAGGTAAGGPSAAAGWGGTECHPVPGSTVAGPGDPRYQDLVQRGFNSRFTAQPDEVHVVHSADQVVHAVNRALRTGKRIGLRSGGHCFDELVDDPSVRLLIDLSEMNDIYYDPFRRAFAVEAGATLGQVYRSLFLGWGVTLPGGVCPSVGVGGHVAGGGYGPLSRRDGLISDHLYAVEVVVADRGRQARSVVATREPWDPNRELWWAHTGGGGGNFGVVTKYWFRKPESNGAGNPAHQLPTPPAVVRKASASWSWSQLTEETFTRLVRNHGQWHLEHDADPAYASLYSGFLLNNAVFWAEDLGNIQLDITFDGTISNVTGLVDAYLSAVSAGAGFDPVVTQYSVPFMKAATTDSYDPGIYDRSKSKGAYQRRPWSHEQITTVYQYLHQPIYTGTGSVLLYSYGGKVNTIDPAATASPQRDSIFKAWFSNFWDDPGNDTANVAWIRQLYRDVYAATGGVPVPNADTDGCYINYPDVDVADAAWNTSGVPWHDLYYKHSYPRLQQVKRRWDPGNVFQHQLSIR